MPTGWSTAGAASHLCCFPTPAPRSPAPSLRACCTTSSWPPSPGCAWRVHLYLLLVEVFEAVLTHQVLLPGRVLLPCAGGGHCGPPSTTAAMAPSVSVPLPLLPPVSLPSGSLLPAASLGPGASGHWSPSPELWGPAIRVPGPLGVRGREGAHPFPCHFLLPLSRALVPSQLLAPRGQLLHLNFIGPVSFVIVVSWKAVSPALSLSFIQTSSDPRPPSSPSPWLEQPAEAKRAACVCKAPALRSVCLGAVV